MLATDRGGQPGLVRVAKPDRKRALCPNPAAYVFLPVGSRASPMQFYRFRPPELGNMTGACDVFPNLFPLPALVNMGLDIFPVDRLDLFHHEFGNSR